LPIRTGPRQQHGAKRLERNTLLAGAGLGHQSTESELRLGQHCNTAFGTTGNHCSQIIFQAVQTTEIPQNGWQPPLPVRIVGQGFGYLPNVTMPLAVIGGSVGSGGSGFTNLVVQNDRASNHLIDPWDSSTNTGCQLYIENWNDSSISVVIGVPVNVQNLYLNDGLTPATYLSPVTDISWLSYEAVSPTLTGTAGCPVNAMDNLTFTVINPQNQGGGSSSATIVVGGSTNTNLL
jgi:hypothetical protein